MPFSGVIVKGLNIQIGCQDQPDEQRVIYPQNSDANILLTFVDEQGQIIDISGATALEFRVLELDGVTPLVKSLSSGIQLVAGKYNQALVSLVAADLALLPPGQSNVQVKVSIAGINYAENLYSAIEVQPQVA